MPVGENRTPDSVLVPSVASIIWGQVPERPHAHLVTSVFKKGVELCAEDIDKLQLRTRLSDNMLPGSIIDFVDSLGVGNKIKRVINQGSHMCIRYSRYTIFVMGHLGKGPYFVVSSNFKQCMIVLGASTPGVGSISQIRSQRPVTCGPKHQFSRWLEWPCK